MKQKIELRSAYNYDTDEASITSGLECQDPTLTIQSQAEETDINYIVMRFGITGQLPQSLRLPTYQDFSEAGDFQTAMDLILQAQESFDQLPAQARAAFQNNPAYFLDFVENNDNPEDWEKLGLATIQRQLQPEKPQDRPLDKTAEKSHISTT